jgi:hypothetical protein
VERSTTLYPTCAFEASRAEQLIVIVRKCSANQVGCAQVNGQLERMNWTIKAASGKRYLKTAIGSLGLTRYKITAKPWTKELVRIKLD